VLARLPPSARKFLEVLSPLLADVDEVSVATTETAVDSLRTAPDDADRPDHGRPDRASKKRDRQKRSQLWRVAKGRARDAVQQLPDRRQPEHRVARRRDDRSAHEALPPFPHYLDEEKRGDEREQVRLIFRSTEQLGEQPVASLVEDDEDEPQVRTSGAEDDATEGAEVSLI
jgi:hypothetical protein